MDLREKLISLLCGAMFVFDIRKNEPNINPLAVIADHLIANGVTVQELLTSCKQWIPVTKETPTESDGSVWVCLADKFPYNEKEPYLGAKHDRRVTEAFYSEYSKRWYKDGELFPDGAVTHWMEKAEPPKEGEW